jgi:hypothetical protein
MGECGTGYLCEKGYCEHTTVGADLDEREPRREMCPAPLPPPELPLATFGDAQPNWSVHVPAMPVPREMRETAAPKFAKRGLAGDSAERKAAPVYEGVLCYFPNALTEVARVSKMGNDKHNPGQPLHWAYGKSMDHGDCIVRHQMQAEEIDDSDGGDGVFHAAKVAWRALAQLEMLLLNRYPELKPGKNVKGFVR